MDTTPLDLVLGRLGGVKRAGKGHTAFCPVHEADGNSHKPSLSISTGTDGKVLLKCMSRGCSFDQIVRAMDLAPKDLFPPDHTQVEPKRIVATYDYRDELGELLYQVVRFEPKGFRQRRPEGADWIWNLNGTRRVLYRLPELLNAREDCPEAWCFIVEGEKDADNLRAHNLIATCNAQGAGKWSPEFAPVFTGARVCIIADKDKAGRRHAQAIAESLRGHALIARVVELPGAMVKDASDFLTHGGTAAQLIEFANTAPAENSTGLLCRFASEIAPCDLRWLWPGRFISGAINLLIGMPDVGKSVLTCKLAATITQPKEKWPLLPDEDWAEPEHGYCAIFAAEDSAEAMIVPRLMAAGADLSKIAIVEGVARLNSDGEKVRDAFDISRDVAYLESLRQDIAKRGNGRLVCVFIDPLDSYLNAAVDTNIGNKARAAMWPIKDWAEQHNITIIIVHHFNKSPTGLAIDKVSGARSFGALPRAVWALGRDPRDEDLTVMAPIKLNAIRRADKRSLGYRLMPSPGNPKVPEVQWDKDYVSLSAGEIVAGKRTAKDDAEDWIKETLAGGPMPAKEFMEMAKASGFSAPTINRAKVGAKATSRPKKDLETGKLICWEWALDK